MGRLPRPRVGPACVGACHVGGQDVSWDFMQTMSLWFLGVFKLFLWFLVLVALWLTLWARQLRNLDRQATK
jgi:hypothetical protein